MYVRIRLSVLFASLILSVFAAEDDVAGWSPLFNGKDLDGWTVKVAGQEVGVDAHNTFRVEDGMIKAVYDDYAVFRQQFGQLYTHSPYSHYVLQLDYKLTGEVMADAPSWTRRNSGVMIHSQSPLSMTVEQWAICIVVALSLLVVEEVRKMLKVRTDDEPAGTTPPVAVAA